MAQECKKCGDPLGKRYPWDQRRDGKFCSDKCKCVAKARKPDRQKVKENE